MDVNAKAVFFACQEAAKLLAAGGGGAIINMADASWERPWPSYIPLHDGQGRGRLPDARPGPSARPAEHPRQRHRAGGRSCCPTTPPTPTSPGSVRRVPLGRLGSPEDIADAAEFLLFRAPYVTGGCAAGGWGAGGRGLKRMRRGVTLLR
jgi:NAD(P)-dependent dehydrogenase (short-subunit alcohol dehydrogenase family)